MRISVNMVTFSVFPKGSGHFHETHLSISRLKLMEDFVFGTSVNQLVLLIQDTTGWGPLSRSSRCCQNAIFFRESCYWGGGPLSGSSWCCQKCRLFLWIGTLGVDSPLWTARAGMCPTGRFLFLINFGLTLCSGRILVQSCWQSPMISSKVLCSVPKSYVQFQKLMFSSQVLCSVPKVLCSGS